MKLWPRSQRRNDELDQELRAHLALAARSYEEQGYSAAEAMSRARREFGNEHVVRELTRDTWGGARLEEIVQDVTYGLRGLRRSPGFTAAVLLSLALGIGVNIAVFTLTDATLNRPLPFPAEEGIVSISEENPAKGIRGRASPGNILDWREATDVFSGLAAFYSRSVVVTEEENAEVIVGSQVTADFFGIFGVRPALGRLFTPEEIEAGLSETANNQAPGPVVVSDRFWKRRFGGSPEALGRTISLDGATRQIVGVMPAAFVPSNADVEVWLPWDLARAYARLKAVPRDWRFVEVNARLREGVPIEAAAARMSALASVLATRHPDTNAGWSVAIRPLRDELTGDARPTLLALLAAVLLVLLLTSANVANLQIARGAVREREIAVRLALGGSRPRLMRQLLTESLLLFAMGGALGVAVAALLVRDLAVLLPYSIVALDQLRVDGRVLLFAVLITLGAGVCAGLLPAMRTAAVGASAVFGGASRGGASLRLGARRWLVAGQVAIALVLVTGASLLVQSVWTLRRVDPGFETAERLMMHVSLNTRKYNTGEGRIAYFDRLTERLAAIPGVSSVGGTTVLPMAEGGTDFNRPYWRADRPRPDGAPTPVDIRMVLPGYIASMGMRVTAGRDIEDEDGPTGRPVVMINDRLARLTWPGEDPVGKQIVLDYRGGAYPYEIVGVVNDTRHGLRREALPEVFIPYRQNAYPALFLVVQGRLDPARLIASARQALIETDPVQPAQRIITMEALVEGTLNRERLATRLFGAMAGIALLLSALGIWGIVDYSVSQSTRDIGLRMAIGARPAVVLRETISHSARLVLAGVLAGGFMLWPLSAGVRSLLFGVSPLDPATIGSSALLLIGAGLLSALGPSRRATRVDPSTALRSD